MLLEEWDKGLDFELLCWSEGWFVLAGGVGFYIVNTWQACMHAAGVVLQVVVGLAAAQNHPEEKYFALIS